jgi:hypothetical protein
MYEGEKKREKMYYSGDLVMVAVRNFFKNADGISFSTAVQILFILF